MSWWWLAILALAGVVFWLRRRRRLRNDAVLQESIDHLGPHAEPKRPPAKQPWHRPGFGPAPRMSALDLGSGPLPPAAGATENPDLAGPMPDDEDVPAMIPIDMSDELEGDDAPTVKPPLPPPPPPPPADVGVVENPADDPAAATIDSLDPIIGGFDEVEVEFDPLRGPQVVELPPELADEVRDLMSRRREVAAVRLICDSMGVGILDAQRTVRSLVGR
ncbi:MAG TPA: hypothetical protein VEX15_13040 [Nocardioidaceae bacterium]|nr:hypothetical protein [Nocardioidaceae bacterium]